MQISYAMQMFIPEVLALNMAEGSHPSWTSPRAMEIKNVLPEKSPQALLAQKHCSKVRSSKRKQKNRHSTARKRSKLRWKRMPNKAIRLTCNTAHSTPLIEKLLLNEI